MTIIEFYDRNAIENIVSTLLCKPERVVLVGDSNRRIRNAVENYRQIAADRGLEVEFMTLQVSKNNLTAIVEALNGLIETYGQCTFDLAGGDELYLVAAGILSECYGPERVQLHRFNIRNGVLTDCDADGNLMHSEPAEISIEENVRAYGGRLVYADEEGGGTESWDFTRDFIADIYSMWEFCRENPTRWNTQIHALGGMNGEAGPESLQFRVDRDAAELELGKKGIVYVVWQAFFDRLRRKALIRNLQIDDNTLAFEFKNSQVKRCLTKAGQILELFITVTALEQGVYNDVLCGAVVDWDGGEEDGPADTRNEIDVLMMKGLVPVFVSCKNGQVSIDELYKLNTVAERFGGRYAKKVLVATELDKMKGSERYIRARAGDMGIRILDDVDVADYDKIERAIRSLWSN